MPTRYGILLLALLTASAGRADLKQANAEPNLEKRSKLAMDNAHAALKKAREAYQSGNQEQTRASVAEVGESVALAMTSLRQTGKNPRKSPKWFKRAELGSRDLSRRLEAFALEMSYTDRPMLDKVRAEVQHAHEELLTGLLEGKKR
jgi:hypothetical protein